MDQHEPTSGGRLPRPVRAVVFDLDGTLLDTEGPYRTAFMAALAEFGASLPDRAYEGLVGLSTPARRALLPALLGGRVPPDAFVAAYYRQRAAVLADGIRLKPGAGLLLSLLRRHGLPVAVATSASAATAGRHLALAGLGAAFATVVSRDDVARGKPAPDSFLRAAALLGVPPGACLAVEDSANGAAAAHAAGMMLAVVPDIAPPSARMLRRCHVLAASLGEVAALLDTAAMQPAGADDRSRLRV